MVDAEEVDVPEEGNLPQARDRAFGDPARHEVFEGKGSPDLEDGLAKEEGEPTRGRVRARRSMEREDVADAREKQDDGLEVGMRLLQTHNVASFEEEVQPSDPFPPNP